MTDPDDLRVLAHIRRRGTGITTRDLARLSYLPVGSVEKAADRLIKQGLIDGRWAPLPSGPIRLFTPLDNERQS